MGKNRSESFCWGLMVFALAVPHKPQIGRKHAPPGEKGQFS